MRKLLLFVIILLCIRLLMLETVQNLTITWGWVTGITTVLLLATILRDDVVDGVDKLFEGKN